MTKDGWGDEDEDEDGRVRDFQLLFLVENTEKKTCWSCFFCSSGFALALAQDVAFIISVCSIY